MYRLGYIVLALGFFISAVLIFFPPAPPFGQHELPPPTEDVPRAIPSAGTTPPEVATISPPISGPRVAGTPTYSREERRKNTKTDALAELRSDLDAVADKADLFVQKAISLSSRLDALAAKSDGIDKSLDVIRAAINKQSDHIYLLLGVIIAFFTMVIGGLTAGAHLVNAWVNLQNHREKWSIPKQVKNGSSIDGNLPMDEVKDRN